MLFPPKLNISGQSLISVMVRAKGKSIRINRSIKNSQRFSLTQGNTGRQQMFQKVLPDPSCPGKRRRLQLRPSIMKVLVVRQNEMMNPGNLMHSWDSLGSSCLWGTSLVTKSLTHLPGGKHYWEKSSGNQLSIQAPNTVLQCLVQPCLRLRGAALPQGPLKERGHLRLGD